MRLCVVTYLLLFASTVHAHRSYESYLSLTTGEQNASFVWEIETNNFETLFNLDDSDNGIVSWKELKNHQIELIDYAFDHIRIMVDERLIEYSNMTVDVARRDDQSYLVVSGQLDIEQALQPRNLQLEYNLFFDQDDQQRLLFSFHSNTVHYLSVVSPNRRQLTLDMATGKANALSTWTLFLEEGVKHLMIGADHLAFLLLQILAVVSFYRTAVVSRLCLGLTKAVTAFTLGHSLTLGLAAFELVSLSSRWVEVAIAATVFWAAWDNFSRSSGLRGLKSLSEKSSLSLVFCFGLIHGFGFANVLSALDMPQSQFALALFGFNLGLELAQLGLVVLALPLLLALRRYKEILEGVVKAVSLFMGALAIFWVIQRI